MPSYDRVWRKEPLSEMAGQPSPRQAILEVFEAAVRLAVEDGSRDGCLLVNTAPELSAHDGRATGR